MARTQAPPRRTTWHEPLLRCVSDKASTP